MKRFFSVSFLFLVLVADASGQTVQLTLDDAVARGVEASHRLADYAERQAAARAVERQREAAAMPQIAAIGSYTRTNHVEEFTVPTAGGGMRVIYPDVPDNLRSRIDLQWPLYTAGRIGALERAAGADADALGQDREAAVADLKLEITRAFWAVVSARASRDVVRQALGRTAAHLTDVRNQRSVGLVPPSDVLTIEAQQAHQQMLSIEAENLVETTSSELRRLVGLAPDAPFELVAVFAARPADLKVGATQAAVAQDFSPADLKVGATQAVVAQDFSPADLKVGATQAAVAQDFSPADLKVGATQAVVAQDFSPAPNRPERKALLFRIDAARERAHAASAGTLPSVTAAGGYDMARPNPRIFPIQEKWQPSWDVGVTLRWSLFDGGRVRAETAEAAANRRSLEARLREFDSAVDVEIRQRRAELRSARAAITAAEAGVRAAAEARRVLADRFAAGVATNTDVLNAQVGLLQAELDVTRARVSAELASARLQRAMGQ